MGGQCHALAASLPLKRRCTPYRRLGELQGRSGRARKISHPWGFDPRTVQPAKYTENVKGLTPEGYPETSANNYLSTLRNIQEERKSHLPCTYSNKFCKYVLQANTMTHGKEQT